MTKAPIPAFFLALAVSSLLTQPASAFNATGHRVIGYVAAAKVCKQTRAAIAQLDPDRSLAEAGVWADEIRDEPYWDALKPWHYMNIPDGVALENARRSRRGDVLLGIEKFAAELADPATDELDRKVAYRLLVHFIGDIHQLLHVGRRKDAGGNRITVRVDERLTSLHAYWDGYELAERVADPADYAQVLLRRYAQEAAAPDGRPADWAEESLRLRAQAYAVPAGSIPELGAQYRENAMQIIDLRIYEAGVRVAQMLDTIFCDATEVRGTERAEPGFWRRLFSRP